ncbi:MAG TPA: PQQ-binding-like beta-propeller repeat protein [Pirellulales bacterium]|jgi:outer membrane protein assembly factor BamB/tetratricopeptide (TPR) repeat protein|nr:PQQ-binding-like beta-propeller repeat protein [Pirellulales bacterium]
MTDRTAIRFRVLTGLAIGSLSAVIVGFVITTIGSAQLRVRFGPNGQPIQPDASDEKDSVLPVDRDTRRLLQKAQEAIKAEQYGDAVDILNRVICGEKGAEAEDYFYQADDKNDGVYHSLKVDAQQMIASLPDKGREQYEASYGPEAKRLLTSAIETGDATLLEKASRNYLHTAAGREATILLSQHYLDHAQPLSAALCLRRVQSSPAAAAQFEPMLSISLATAWLRAGYQDKAKEALVELKKKTPRGSIKFGDKTLPLFDKDADAISWLATSVGQMKLLAPAELAQWTMFRGNASRNAISAGGSPVLNERWRVDTTMDEKVQKSIEAVKKQQREQSAGVLIPSGHPLAVVAKLSDKEGHVTTKDFVLMRTPTCLWGVDFHSGKLIWRYPPESDTSNQVVSEPTNGQQQMQMAQVMMMRQAAFAGGNLTDRLWDSPTYGTMSSDGESVYLVDEVDNAPMTQPQMMGGRRIIMANGQLVAAGALAQSNKLVSVELATEGKLRWAVGGSNGTDEPKLAGVFFLGPPLPLMDRLYAIGENNGVIQLYVLNSKDGHLEWSQQLAQIVESIQFDPTRRMTGASPSFADGVLVCPTSANSVVAVDLATRTLLWGYQYERSQYSMQMGAGFAVMSSGDMNQANATHWADSCITIADGKAIISPMESDQLHCLNLVDGKFLWKKPREENVYVACVHKGNVILVGRKAIQARKLSDGEFAWSQHGVAFPGGASPSGRGFYSGNSYFVPLTSAAVARIDLDTGDVKEVFKSHKGYIPGNLICFHDNIISQGVDYLEAFYQLEPLKVRIAAQLKQNPDDPDALTRRGEISYVDGKLPEALADLRKANAIKPQIETHDLLLEALFAALQADFVKNRGDLAEAEKMIDLPSERATFLRIKAAGLMKAGEIAPAIATYLALADLDLNHSDLETISADYSVRRDRWLQGQLTSLLKTAKPDDLQKINAAVESRLEVALAAEPVEKKITLLRRFLNYFSAHATADVAREQLASLLTKRETVLEREELLQTLEASSDPARRRAATARLAQMLADAGRPEDAAQYYHKLQQDFANEVCLGDKTGQQLFDELPKDSPVRRSLVAAASWPYGEVKSERGAVNTTRLNRMAGFRQYFPIEFHGSRGPFQQNTCLFYDMQQFLIARDGLGQEEWRVNLLEKQVQNQYGYLQGMNQAQVRGHLIVLNIGTNILAIDTLRSDGGRNGSGDRVLWKQDLVEQFNGVQINRGINQTQVANPWGGPMKFQAIDNATNQPFGGLGALTAHGVIIQRSREIQCLDALTGEVVWSRQGVPAGSDTFGDDEYLIVAPPEGKGALVLRSIDGEIVGKRDVPPRDQRWTTIGRKILTWNNVGGKINLLLRDPWENKDVWTKEFASDSKGTIINNDEVAIMEHGGKLQILDILTGAKRIDETVDADPSLASLYVVRSKDQYLVVSSSLGGGSAQSVTFENQTIQSPMGEMFSPLVIGHVYAYDRATGKKQWSIGADVQRYALMLQQPADLPVLTFLRQVYDQKRGGAVRAGILCLDKRTGRAAYEEDNLQTHFNNMFDITGDLDAHTVVMTYPNQSITLKFTDLPISPEPPYQASLTVGEPPKGFGGFIRAVGKALGGAEANK